MLARFSMHRFPRWIAGLAVAVALCGAGASAARARVFIGVGVPLFVPPPVVIPPPAYYPPYYGAPPWAYGAPGSEFSYTPPQSQPRGPIRPRESVIGEEAESCHAGRYVCPLVEETPVGGRCFCPTNDGRRVRGRAS